jgi:hypothetical protein
MSQTATIIIAIIALIGLFYPTISSFFQKDAEDPDGITSTGDDIFAIRNKKGELIEVDFTKSDAAEKSILFLTALLEKY